jgi:hypothetical protein
MREVEVVDDLDEDPGTVAPVVGDDREAGRRQE